MDLETSCCGLSARGWLRARDLTQFWELLSLRVLVASAFPEASWREVCETAGKNVTVTKHGFESGRVASASGSAPRGASERDVQ
jgi:hypothetical protein